VTFDLDSRRIIFVGGKGGVGKTTTAAAVALHLAESGRRCLVVSTDPAHSLGDVFETPIGPRTRALAPNLEGLELDPDAQVDAYLRDVKGHMRDLVRPAMYDEVDRQVELARSSPGAVEAAMLEQVAQLMTGESGDFEVLVFDTAPTGQTLRLLALPELMAAWTDGLLRHRARSDEMADAIGRLAPGVSRRRGDELSHFEHAGEGGDVDPRFARIRETLQRRQRSFRQARRLLLDANVTALVMVLVPERLPLLETQKAVEALRRAEVPIAGLVVNRVLPEGSLGTFLEERRAQERRYLALIHESFRNLPQVRVPLFGRDVGGLDALREVGGHILSETPVV